VRFRQRLPREIVDAITLDRGERALAWATDDAGRHVVATDLGLVLQRHPPGYERLDWDTIERASLDGGVMVLRLVSADGNSGETLHLRIGEQRDLAVAVRDRLTASIVLNQHFALRGRRGVRIVARRSPKTGTLTWSWLLDRGLDLDDDLRSTARDLLEQVRRESGVE
jgi:hypothetical protein